MKIFPNSQIPNQPQNKHDEVFEKALREARSTMKGLARDTKPAPALKCLGQQKTEEGGGRVR